MQAKHAIGAKSVFYIAIALLLVFLMYYSYVSHDKYYPSISDFVKNPERYDNVLTEQQVKISNVTKDSFITRFGNDYAEVKYQGVEQPKYGLLTFMGYYKKEGYIQATKIRYNNYAYGKYFLSFLGLLMFIIIFFKEWKLTSGGFEDA